MIIIHHTLAHKNAHSHLRSHIFCTRTQPTAKFALKINEALARGAARCIKTSQTHRQTDKNKHKQRHKHAHGALTYLTCTRRHVSLTFTTEYVKAVVIRPRTSLKIQHGKLIRNRNNIIINLTMVRRERTSILIKQVNGKQILPLYEEISNVKLHTLTGKHIRTYTHTDKAKEKNEQ